MLDLISRITLLLSIPTDVVLLKEDTDEEVALLDTDRITGASLSG